MITEYQAIAQKTPSHRYYDTSQHKQATEEYAGTKMSHNISQMPFACTLCWKSYATPQNLKRHMITHQGKFSCPVCDSKFSQKYSIRNHLRSVHNSIQCPTCSMVFSVGDSFNKHVLHCK